MIQFENPEYPTKEEVVARNKQAFSDAATTIRRIGGEEVLAFENSVTIPNDDLVTTEPEAAMWFQWMAGRVEEHEGLSFFPRQQGFVTDIDIGGATGFSATRRTQYIDGDDGEKKDQIETAMMMVKKDDPDQSPRYGTLLINLAYVADKDAGRLNTMLSVYDSEKRKWCVPDDEGFQQAKVLVASIIKNYAFEYYKERVNAASEKGDIVGMLKVVDDAGHHLFGGVMRDLLSDKKVDLGEREPKTNGTRDAELAAAMRGLHTLTTKH